MRSLSLCAVPLALIFVLPVVAMDAGRLINGDFNSSSRKDRLEICYDVRSKVMNLLQYVPIPKPSEVDWVNSERAAIEIITDPEAKSARLEKLSEGPEFQQIRLRADLQQIINFMDAITTRNIPVKKEMLYWCIASHGLTNNEEMNDAIKILIQAGRLPEDLALKVKLGQAIGYTGVLGWFGRGIQEFLVIPFLAGKIKT